MQKGQKIIVGVLGLPIRKNGKTIEFFLSQRLAPYKPDIHLKWQLSGGVMEFGETPQQTLIREFQEELSVIPEISYPYPIVITNTWRKGVAGHNHNAHVVLIAFLVDIDNQIPKNTDPDHETGDMKWYSIDEIKDLNCLPNTHQIISYAQDILDKSPNILL